MSSGFDATFTALRAVFAPVAAQLAVQRDTPEEYTLQTTRPSPFPQHRGRPMFFGSVRRGKAYVSLHLMPLYMNPELTAAISPALKKRMQGKTCFNFKSAPEPALLEELTALAQAGLKAFQEKAWA